MIENKLKAKKNQTFQTSISDNELMRFGHTITLSKFNIPKLKLTNNQQFYSEEQKEQVQNMTYAMTHTYSDSKSKVGSN